jgi:hypothetical protein
MGRVVLLVEPSDRRRADLRRAFTRVSHPIYEVGDAVDAMVAIGRAEFGALVASEGRRQLSLRGLCHLARRRHAGIVIFVLGDPGTESELRARLGVDVRVLSSAMPAREVAEAVDEAMARVPAPFDTLQETEVLSRGEVLEEIRYDTDSGPSPSQVDFDSPLVSQEGVLGPPSAVDISSLAAESPDTERLPAAPSLGEFAEETLLDHSDSERSVLGPEIDDDEEAEATILDVERPDFGHIAMVTGGHTDDGPRTTSDPPARSAETDPDVSDTERQPVAPSHVAPSALFEGDLTDGGGPSLLMGVYTQEVTGRLEITGGRAEGTVFFYGGEPVAARHPLGDAGLLARLVARGVLRSELEAPRAPEGLLLSTLVGAGQLRGQELHEFLREFVRDRVVALIESDEGSYRFVEDSAFLLTTPLLKVNPFGLVVERLRRNIPGQKLLDKSREVMNRWIEPTPALAVVAGRLAAFTRGVDLGAKLVGRSRVGDLLASAGIDPLHGALIVLSLVEARLARFIAEEVVSAPQAVPAMVELDPAPTIRIKALPDSELSDDLSDHEQEARDEIFALYMRLKPLTRPAHVLGVELTASKREMEEAYQRRMRDLDLDRIPEGSAQALLISRVEELRAKVTRAFEALKLQHDLATKKVHALGDTGSGEGGSNPW